MDLPPDLLTMPAKRAARLVALTLLEEVDRARVRVERRGDAEALHDFRVALRRLRSWMRAYDTQLEGSVSKRLRRGIKRIAAVTSESRDGEVHLEWLGEQMDHMASRRRESAERLRAALAGRKADADERLDRALTERFPRVRRKLSRSLDLYRTKHYVRHPRREQSMADVSAQLVAEHGTELEARLSEVASIDDQVKAHRARIAGKRLRYLLEPLADRSGAASEAVKQLKGLQDTLGDMHDADVLLGEVETLLADTRKLEGAGAVSAPESSVGATPPPQADVSASSTPTQPRPRSQPQMSVLGLESLAKRLRQRRKKAFASLAQQWLRSGGSVLFEAVRLVVEQLQESVPHDTEIERKYLLTSLPQRAEGSSAREIEQGYIPGDRLVERLRVERNNGDVRRYRTIKLGQGLARTEVEEETSAELFDSMWPLTDGRRVRKRRFVVDGGEHTWEIDLFLDRDLVLAEVELRHEDATVEMPDWLAPFVVREVTGDPAFLNLNLAH